MEKGLAWKKNETKDPAVEHYPSKQIKQCLYIFVRI